MKRLDKKIAILIGAFLAAAGATHAKPFAPEDLFTEAQGKACAPRLVVASDGDAKKSSLGESVTATARSTIRASKARFLYIPDEGSLAFVDYAQGGVHVNRPGKPVVTERVAGGFPKALALKSEAHRGKSFRTGRNASVHNHLAAYEVNGSMECILALNLLNFDIK